MYIHGPSHLHAAQPINPPHRTHVSEIEHSSQQTTGVDQLDISHEAELISQVREMPDVRADRIAQIRSEIEAGTYETQHKMDVALGRLIDELAG